MTPFARRVLSVLRQVPAGRVTTYGEVARLAGRPRAARAVGHIFREAAEPGLPYHRVIAAGGRIGGYGRNPHLKAALLMAEGHTVRRGRIIGFKERRWPSKEDETLKGRNAERVKARKRDGMNARKG
jgi:O-6-methylguanine DNA methyltransferase